MTAPLPLWLDYRRPPPGEQAPGIALLAVGVALAAALAWLGQDTGRQLDAAGDQVARLRQAAERQRLQAAASAATAQAGDGTPSPSAARWEALFATLERAGDDKVTLLGLAPAAREVRIDGEALNLPAALDYAQRLQAGTALANAHVARYEIVRDNPRQPVRFTVQANWREDR